MIRRLYFRFVLPCLRRLPFPSTVLGPVKGHHSSFPEWAAARGPAAPGELPLEVGPRGRKSSSAAPHGKIPRVLGLQPARREPLSPPLLALPRLPPELARETRPSLPQNYVGVLPRGRVATRFHEVISTQDRVFADLLYAQPGGAVRAHSLILPRLPRLRPMAGRLAAISTGRASNYYHWLNDCLPRLWLLERAGLEDFRLLIPAKGSAFHRRSLELLGFADDRLVPFGDQHWRVEELLVPSLTNSVGHAHPEACRWLRRRLLDSPPVVAARQAAEYPKRLFISRQRAGKRRLINEAEVISSLRQRGFLALVAESMPLEQQLAHFAAAEVVVAPHGAGLTNCLFMKPGSLVVELLPWLKVKSCYFSLAHAGRHRYACVSNAPAEEGQRPEGRQPDRDFSIPVTRLEAALDRLEIQAP